MVKKKTAVPGSAIPIRNYAELMPWLEQYQAGKFNCLTVLSSPGLLKSTMLRELVGRADDDRNPGHGIWIEGNDSAFIAHCRIWETMGDPQGPTHDLLILDDVEEWNEPRSRKYLKTLLNTEPVKWPSWDNAATRRLGVPGKFPVACKVCWLANEFNVKSINDLAIFDRTICLHFCPTAEGLHAEILRRETFTDREILGFVGSYLRSIVRPTARQYYHAKEIKDAGHDWQGWLLQQWFADQAVVDVMKLAGDPVLANGNKRYAEFVRRGRGCKRTFSDELRQLEGNHKTDSVFLPPVTERKTETVLALHGGGRGDPTPESVDELRIEDLNKPTDTIIWEEI